ncbi:transcription antitermination factor NusB [Aurantimonas sp. VKM B-3413]|uniref:RsmB/NOP family class I SAM-dependent RNA methyltransferase n=1 Tax=Aurantimonas sp. VKM B-3413 TaxID=2779401 RepID=UPI001E62347F|nr:methyltransferase domain-containing protein [Aurantimonas sp. VKM B-3413]
MKGRGAGSEAGGADPAASAPRPGLPARQVAARLLAAVVEAKTSLDGLTDPSHGHPQFRRLEPRDQGLVRAILQTALRFRGSLDQEIAARIERPLPPNASALRHVLHVGAAQILYLDIPDSAAVDLAVASAAADPRTARFKNLVNAVLRRIAREAASGTAAADPLVDCPAWLRERLEAQYGVERAGAIAAVHRRPAPVDITVKSDPAGWAERLGGRVIAGGSVRLERLEAPVPELGGFADGEWWVQDVAAALPARLVAAAPGERVADLCAAPGGKTAQLALTGANVTALDLSASRMKRLSENLSRLGLEAETVVGDLSAFSPSEPFDAVLLDAPCSSTGTIRRHPDVAYTKDAAEIDKLAGVQARLLGEAARLVKRGGRLVFSNCSLDRAEGEAVVEAFLSDHPEFRRLPVLPEEITDFGFAISAAGDLRTTPDMLAGEAGKAGGLDGFYAARLIRDQ